MRTAEHVKVQSISGNDESDHVKVLGLSDNLGCYRIETSRP